MADAVKILQDLIRCPSITPIEGGAITHLEKLLARHGFKCQRLKFSEAGEEDVENLYARWGTSAPNICFAGHTDVVPTGDTKNWSFDPFCGNIKNDEICGRGAVDMKGGIAAFAAAAINYIEAHKPAGSISFLITGDEEGPAVNGTKKVLDWMAEHGEEIDFCIVGEPTSKDVLGDVVKIGRRGTLTGYLTVDGVQGHVAYPQLANNPVTKMARLVTLLDDLVLDAGTAHFQPSNLETTNIHVGNTADNVIPAQARATFNIRFNDTYTGASLEKKIRETLDSAGIPYHLDMGLGGESFYTPPGAHSQLVCDAIEKVLGKAPELSTTGGTSDARFIRQFCPVVEFGVCNALAHKVDERVPVQDIENLTKIYSETLKAWFKG